MRHALRLIVLGLGLTALPAHAQSTAPSLTPIGSFGQESLTGSAYEGVSFGLAPFVGGALRFQLDPFAPARFTAVGYLADDRWGFGRRMFFMTLGSWNSYEGAWVYTEWCPRDPWWAYLVSDVVVSLLDRRYDRDWGPPVVSVSAPRPRVTYKEPPEQTPRHAKPRSVILDPIPHVRPLLSPRPPRSVPPRGHEQPAARRGRSILGSLLDGLGQATVSGLGRAVGRAVTGSSKAEARGRSEAHKDRGSTRSARPRTAKRRGSGGGRS